jgi:hypothetical protein
VGRNSSVGIASHYGLDGPEGTRFSTHVQTGPVAHPTSYNMDTVFFPGVKRPERGVNHPPPSSAEVKERVDLYVYSPYGALWPVLGCLLPLICRVYVNVSTRSDLRNIPQSIYRRSSHSDVTGVTAVRAVHLIQ